MGRLLAYERGKGPRGEPGGSPAFSPRPSRRSQRRGGRGEPQRRGYVGETWFPPRERAEGERRSFAPPLRDLDVETELIEGPADDEVDEVVDRFGSVIEARSEEQHGRAGFLDRERVAQVDQRQRRLARHHDELPLLFQSHGRRTVDEVRHRA